MNEEEKKDLTNRIGKKAYDVTQKGVTEAPFTGEYYKIDAEGKYKCIVCGNLLFDSKTKFDSFSGWPSFYDIASNDSVILKTDSSFFGKRTEVLCKKCDAHLGHVFEDAPDQPTNKRYCINSVALDLEED